MPRFRIRNLLDNGYFDACTAEIFVRSPDNRKWIRLIPGKFSIRDGANANWLHIDCNFDPQFDDPCAVVTLTGPNCQGAKNDQYAGSGDGTGSGGAKYDLINGYPPGYDMPDAGMTAFGQEINSGIAPIGLQIRRPGVNEIVAESYDDVGAASRYGLATWVNPNPVGASIHGRGAAVTESIYTLGQARGTVEILFACYSESGISIDVYYVGKRMATTCGRVTGRGRLQFYYDPVAGDYEDRIMIRIRGAENTAFSYQVIGPFYATVEDIANLDLNYFVGYNMGADYGVLLQPKYLGTPAFPAPCHATVFPMKDRLDRDFVEYYHYMGEYEGTVYLDFNSWDTFDYVEVYHAGHRIATTLNAATGKGYLKFKYKPVPGNYDLMVRIVAQDFGIESSLESWYYSLYCPDTKGARVLPWRCDEIEITSAGHPVTEDNFDITVEADRTAVIIEVFPNSSETHFAVYDQNDNLLDQITARAPATLEFMRMPVHLPARNRIYVRCTSGIGCDWRYVVRCPVSMIDVDNDAQDVPYSCVQVGFPQDLPAPDAFEWTRVVKYLASGSQELVMPWKWNHQYKFQWDDPSGEREMNTEMTATNRFIVESVPGAGYDAWDNVEFDRAGFSAIGHARQSFIEMWWHKSDGTCTTNLDTVEDRKLRVAGRGRIYSVLEREMIYVPRGSAISPDANEWEIIFDARTDSLANATWQVGYEYAVWHVNYPGENEAEFSHIIVPQEVVDYMNILKANNVPAGGYTEIMISRQGYDGNSVYFMWNGEIQCISEGRGTAETLVMVARRPITQTGNDLSDWQLIAGQTDQLQLLADHEYFVFTLFDYGARRDVRQAPPDDGRSKWALTCTTVTCERYMVEQMNATNHPGKQWNIVNPGSDPTGLVVTKYIPWNRSEEFPRVARFNEDHTDRNRIKLVFQRKLRIRDIQQHDVFPVQIIGRYAQTSAYFDFKIGDVVTGQAVGYTGPGAFAPITVDQLPKTVTVNHSYQTASTTSYIVIESNRIRAVISGSVGAILDVWVNRV